MFGIFLPEDESNVGSENVVETEKEAEVEKKVETTKSESVSNNNFKSDVDVVETLKNRGASTTPSFTISDAQGNFINSHINLFPAEFSDFEEVSNYIDYTLDYAHMAKNPKSYIGKFAFVDGLKVIQVAEQEYNYGSSQYNYVTVMTLKDDSEHIYVVYYIGKSIELVQGDYARIIAMPIEYSSYKNLENNSVLSLVMVASVAENSDQKEITNGYFSDEPDYSGIAENTNTQDDYYIFPDSDSRYYTEDELRMCADEELRLGRNEIYARHGYIFGSADLNSYFQSMNWYHGYLTADQFDDSVLNEYERANLDMIKREEEWRK